MDTISLSSVDLSIEIAPFGARLQSVTFDGISDLVHSAADKADAKASKKYNGAVVGPVANRIAGANADIDGKTHSFEANQNGNVTLHSGSAGLHARQWRVVTQSDSAVSLALGMPDGEGGFPGNREFYANFSLRGDVLEVVLTATSDAPTWVNLALHPYWSLGTEGRAGQRLMVNAASYLPVDDDQIPTGEIAPVDGTLFDLRELGEPSIEIDHNYCLEPSQNAMPAVTLDGDKGVRIDITTDAPGLQVYSGKPVGIAIEPQHWPDAMHHSGFPSIELRPGETYSQTSTYLFSRI